MPCTGASEGRPAMGARFLLFCWPRNGGGLFRLVFDPWVGCSCVGGLFVRAVCVHGACVARLRVCASAAVLLFARRLPLTPAIAFEASQMCC